MPYEPEILDSDNQHHKDIYAYFGLASYHAQCLETSLGLFLLLYKKLNNFNLTLQEFEDLEVDLQKKTMGALVREFRKHAKVNDEAEALLDEALEKRNFLTHHYFRERAEYWLSEGGRNKMLDELIDIDNHLRKADVLIVAMYSTMSRILGVTDELIEQELADLKAKADSFNI